MDVIIIEDELLLANELACNLKALDDSIKVVGKLGNVRDSIEWLRNNSCDLIFSDIELTDGLSFSIFSQVDVSVPVVFTTAYNQYAIKAFELNSIGYLLKPVEMSDLKKVLDKYREQQLPRIQLSKLIDQINAPGEGSQYLNRVILTLGNVQKPVSVDQIAYFMADDRYLFAITDNGKKYYYDSTLNKLETELNPTFFFRANRRYFVNKQFVSEMVLISRSRLELKMTVETPERIIVSYSKSSDFKKWIAS
ncbi:DNA-binding response regulator [Marinilabiliaceae bacterium JC017]|nr:DNA-binding response regulator [Marinilabiliaceae bacterium JC017]